MVSLAPPSLFLVSDVGSPDGRRDTRGKDRAFIAQEKGEEEEEEARSLFARFLRGESGEEEEGDVVIGRGGGGGGGRPLT